MNIPHTPPPLDDLYPALLPDRERLSAILGRLSEPTVNGRYVHWDKLRHFPPPPGFSREDWWVALKWSRASGRKLIGLTDSTNQPFSFSQVDPLPECLHSIDLRARGKVDAPAVITNVATRDEYVIRSMIEESLTSSQLEGSLATRQQAREMVREGKVPSNQSERMVWNNYRTMQRIREVKDHNLTKELVVELQRIATEATLKDPDASGRFRRPGETIVVGDQFGEVFHTPPPARTLDERMARMCNFANGRTPEGFIHPVIRSILLHFWLAYDHPFVDGNGRTARALFYWSMLRQGYWLFEFVSISRVILKGPMKYGQAFLFTETDDNDLNYFILYHADVIRRSISDLFEYVNHQANEVQYLELRLRGLLRLNPRQKEIVARALKHPNEVYSIQGHMVSHNKVYQTARVDLLNLVERGLFEQFKRGRAFQFRAVPDLEQRLIG